MVCDGLDQRTALRTGMKNGHDNGQTAPRAQTLSAALGEV